MHRKVRPKDFKTTALEYFLVHKKIPLKYYNESHEPLAVKLKLLRTTTKDNLIKRRFPSRFRLIPVLK